MIIDATILRLFVSQAFAVYLILALNPLKEPQRKNTMNVILGACAITLINALLIASIGILFYIRFYFFTLTLPYIILFSYFSFYRGAKFIFALLSIQVIGNVAITNGLFASYFFYGENNPLIDTVARTVTYIFFLPFFFKFVRPTYLKMAVRLDKGWWILSLTLIITYVLTYYILFVPDDIFKRPEYFTHAYIGIVLSLLIYVIIFFLFIEIQVKMTIEQDKLQLSSRVRTLTAESAVITTIAYKDALTGVNNRYSLFRKMQERIENKQPFLVVFIDLDNLKAVNDNYDHTKGDEYLKHFAFALQSAVDEQGEVYRIAGDEFVCLLTSDISQFSRENFRDNVEKEIIIDVPFLGMCIGLSSYPEDAENPDDLIRLADKSMYKEKREKKTRQ